MLLLNPKEPPLDRFDPTTRAILRRTIDFFEHKGRGKLKKDDQERVWYSDFLDLVKREKIFSMLLTPSPYGLSPEARWDTWRNIAFNEITSFYGLHYWYTWQVTILGLGPIWMSDNEAIKRKTAALLLEGAIFAFGLSEKEHGADLYSTEMALTALSDGTFRANGRKYYIGNANQAALVSTFGKLQGTGDYVFFVVGSVTTRSTSVSETSSMPNPSWPSMRSMTTRSPRGTSFPAAAKPGTPASTP
jgi:acyl-CoA dehydrogenase